MTVITLAGAIPPWRDALRNRLPEAATLRHQPDRAQYVATLADTFTALVIVPGTDDDWQFWTTTPKSSPATRRIPVFLVVEDASAWQDAGTLAGADLVLTPESLLHQLDALLAQYARRVDPAVIAQLDCDCQESLPDLARQGVAKFNAGEYYTQHDLFEELWMATDGPVQDLYRAILQVGVAYYQIERGNHRGARKMLLRSVQWLINLPDVCQGVDVAALRADSARVRAELDRLPEDQIDQFDRALLQPVKMVNQAS
jgi:predicted metal-dependent hydrolase